MTSIQRYDAWPQEWPFEDEHGDLVTYEDHRKIVEELEAKLSKSEALLAKAVEALGGMVGLFSGYSLLLKGMHLNMELDNARAALADLSKERSDERGQDDAE